MTQPKELWSYIAAGTRYIEYHSELAAQSQHVDSQSAWDYRLGVGWLRHAGLLVNMIERLRTDTSLKLFLEKRAYKKAIVEGPDFFPHLQTLGFGKGSVQRGDHPRERRSPWSPDDEKDYPSEVEIDAAVAELFAWLRRPQSALRAILLVLAAGGLPYAAMACERTFRAWVQGGNATAERAKVAAKAVRTARVTGSAGSSSSASLPAPREEEISALFLPRRPQAFNIHLRLRFLSTLNLRAVARGS